MITVYDWPASITPMDIKPYILGARIEGGYSLGARQFGNPDPGGRFAIDLTFNNLESSAASRMYGWLCDALQGGSRVFRYPIGEHVETVAAATIAGFGEPIPWIENALESLWDDGAGWLMEPFLTLFAPSLTGQVVIRIDETDHTGLLDIGIVIGIRNPVTGEDHPNRILNISRQGAVADVTLALPLRRDFIAGDLVMLLPWPRMTADPTTIASFRTLHRFGKWTMPGPLTLVEYIG